MLCSKICDTCTQELLLLQPSGDAGDLLLRLPTAQGALPSTVGRGECLARGLSTQHLAARFRPGYARCLPFFTPDCAQEGCGPYLHLASSRLLLPCRNAHCSLTACFPLFYAVMRAANADFVGARRVHVRWPYAYVSQASGSDGRCQQIVEQSLLSSSTKRVGLGSGPTARG